MKEWPAYAVGVVAVLPFLGTEQRQRSRLVKKLKQQERILSVRGPRFAAMGMMQQGIADCAHHTRKNRRSLR